MEVQIGKQIHYFLICLLGAMKYYLEQNIVYPDTVFFSAKYKQLEPKGNPNENWKFDAACDCYNKIREDKLEDYEDYNNPNVVYPYILLNKNTKSDSKAIIRKEPLFRTSMED